MLHRSALYILSLLVLFSCSTSRVAKQHSQQLEYIPAAFHNTYLGMPLEEFKKARKNAMLRGEEGFRSVYLEEFGEGDIKTAIYYFGTKGERPLYEYIFDYHTPEKRDEFADNHLGEPNKGEKWTFDSKEGFKINAWVFKNKLVVAGVIKDTEWYEDENSD